MRLLPFDPLLALTRLIGIALAISGILLLIPVQRQPFTTANGLILVDGLSCLALGTAGLLVVAAPVHARRIGQLFALGVAIVSGHLGGLALGLLLVCFLSEHIWNRLAGIGLASGYLLIGWFASSWRLPFSGDGLNSVSFLLLLTGAALASGALDLPSDQPVTLDPLVALAGFAALLRLFSVGPWNLGWQLATLLVGVALALSAAWRAVNALEPSSAEEWIQRSIGGLILAATGCASPAGVVAAGLLLWHVSLRRLAQPAAGTNAWAGWLLAGAVPGSLGFVALWSVSAAAMTAGVAALAMGVWAAALLLMLAAGRQITGSGRWRSTTGALVGLALGLLAPILTRWMLRPLSDHLQGGLTPYGAIEPWGWAGLLALNAASRTTATAPGLALLGLMIVIGALAWVLSRWRKWI
ncbi:hypothetical protein [Chloroflexus sp.]|uniref:hypothetical protein n=1 Tax=Chloroflexus sp. TaxID=1904827 RepID=UPI0026030DCD|nr:hypothetical protein [uncultured Chloroflexus sp.]